DCSTCPPCRKPFSSLSSPRFPASETNVSNPCMFHARL
ncbi:hypothetical protein Gorai_002854, partial [Gossypium raimondii]|nr:hypothetical protein [Gossypium raimondii]